MGREEHGIPLWQAILFTRTTTDPTSAKVRARMDRPDPSRGLRLVQRDRVVIDQSHALVHVSTDPAHDLRDEMAYGFTMETCRTQSRQKQFY